jgi:hypothetical protein
VYDGTCTCIACDANGATPSAADAVCQTSQAYGSGSLCIGSSCVTANCRSTTGTSGSPKCNAGQICGVTAANQCGPCATSADCTTAYGAGYVCSATGSCVSGGCGTSVDCDTAGTAGQLCGVTQANACGACSSDGQCAGDAHYSADGKTLCDTTSHTCVSATCATNLAACAGTHLCCGTACESGTTFSGTGNNKSCCTAGDCAGDIGFTQCVNNQCSACAAVTNGTFYVDPVGGTDNGASGGDAAGCRFKTLAHALSVASITAGTKTVYLIGDDDPTTNTTESFPLAVPPNTTVAGYDDGGQAVAMHTVLVPAGVVGFQITGSDSGMHHLTIDGVNGASSTPAQRYRNAIQIGASGPTPPTGITLDHVTVTHSLGAGIVIGGVTATATLSATVTLGPGTNVNSAGILGGATPAPASGLVIGGKSVVTLQGGADQSTFSANSQHGIVVANRAAVTINGTPVVGNGDYTGSSIIAQGNQSAGVVIMQNPAGATTASEAWTQMPVCNITGMVIMNSTTGNGFRFQGGSKVKLSGSVSYGNNGDGVRVETGGNVATPAADANYVGAIDLGGLNGSPNGANVLQVPYGNTGATYNHGAGICLAIAPAGGTGQALSAIGNVLVTNADAVADCGGAGGAVAHANNCRSGPGAPASVGVNGGAASKNSITISSCN